MDSIVTKTKEYYPTPISLTPRVGERAVRGGVIVGTIPVGGLITVLEITEPCIISYLSLQLRSPSSSSPNFSLTALKVTGNDKLLVDSGTLSAGSGGMDIIGSAIGFAPNGASDGRGVVGTPMKFESFKVEVDTSTAE